MYQKLGLSRSNWKVKPIPLRAVFANPGGSDQPRGGSRTVSSTTRANSMPGTPKARNANRQP